MIVFNFGARSQELRKATLSFVISVRWHGTTRLPLDEFSQNFMFGGFLGNLPRKFKFH